MDYYEKLRSLEDKLTATLNDEGLVFALDTSKYPITLTVSHNASPAAQMEFFSAEDGASSTDARLKFIFRLDALEIRVDNRFTISDSFMSKIKGQAKKIHHAFLEGFFTEHISYKAKTAAGNSAPLYEAPETDDPDAFADFFDDDREESGLICDQ